MLNSTATEMSRESGKSWGNLVRLMNRIDQIMGKASWFHMSTHLIMSGDFGNDFFVGRAHINSYPAVCRVTDYPTLPLI